MKLIYVRNLIKIMKKIMDLISIHKELEKNQNTNK